MNSLQSSQISLLTLQKLCIITGYDQPTDVFDTWIVWAKSV